MHTILVADDEKNIRSTLTTTFSLEGYRVETVGDGKDVLPRLQQGGIDLIVMDLRMPGMDGLEALTALRAAGHELPVIFLSAHGTIDRAIEAVRLGAFDFIEKPPHADRLLLVARNALRHSQLELENRELREEQWHDTSMIGAAPVMTKLFEQIKLTAPTEARVLIVGENGTGKELIAHALHRHSSRAEGPFIRVNCAAVPRDLFESELFGHERGAFTGATNRRRGKFQRAHRGTLFLDEIGEIPVELQAKLLRVLESGEVEPVGSEREVQVDVRVLAATNCDLERAVEEGRFRRDLYYRLQVVTLRAPSLRERKEDIPPLVERFVQLASEQHHLQGRSIADDAIRRLACHDFPGNVRELRNLVERLLILSRGREIHESDVVAQLGSASSSSETLPATGTLRERMHEVERRLVLSALEQSGWRMSEVARTLGLERSHLYKKLKVLEIQRPE
ncbi:MAG: sigma-54 dependent transcriptional regulator [Acidobacteriota bacterium]|nr:sigma-54 dependent transcriptional regulator [Acidobacteriota bacterium]MDH3786603.1 sigma-54 dependent transcriptional regulator [Acidobacteriota bacterium]